MLTTRSGRQMASQALTLSTQPTELPHQELPDPPTLLSQPAEILHNIASELRACGDRRALSNLCLTSKVLRDVAQVPLFNMFRFSVQVEDANNQCSIDLKYDYQVKVDLLHLIRAVFRREKLAAGIVTIDLDFRCIANPQLPPLEENDKFLFSRTCQMLHSQTMDWKAILGHRGVYGLLALLLTQLRNLRRLSFILSACADMKDKFVFFPLFAQTVPTMFPVLENVSVSGYCEHYNSWMQRQEKDISDFGSVLAIPTLRRFHIDGFRLNRWCNSFIEPARHTWQLSHLHLTNCISLSVQQFEEMMHSFSNLEFLEFTISHGKLEFVLEGFIRAIECHAQSLRCLHLTKTRYGARTSSSNKSKSKPLIIDSMHQFQKMEELRIQASWVGSMYNLPPNLTRLVFKDYAGDRTVLGRSTLQEDSNGMRSLCEVCPLLRDVFVLALSVGELLAWEDSSDTQLDVFDNGLCVFIPSLPYSLYICRCMTERNDQLIEEILFKRSR